MIKKLSIIKILVAIICVSFLLELNIIGLVGLFLIIPIIYLYSNTRPEFLLIFTILISMRFFGTAPSQIFGFAFSKLTIIPVLMGLLLLVSNRNKIRTKKEYWICFSYLLIAFLASVAANFKINQSILVGLLVQISLYTPLLIIPVCSLVKTEDIAIENLYRELNCIAMILCCILCARYFIPSFDAQFSDISSLRNESIRITTGGGVIAYNLFFLFSKIFKKISWINLLEVIFSVFTLVFIVQTRMVILGVFLGVCFGFILSGNFGWKKTKKILLLVAVGVVVFCLFNAKIESLISMTRSEISSNAGNYYARNEERVFYLNQVDNVLLGRGYITPKTVGGESLDTKYGYFSITDIGITGLYVQNGILGLIWYFLLVICIFNFSRKIRKHRGIESFPYYAVFTYSIVSAWSLLPLYYDTSIITLYFVLMILCSRRLKERK